MTQVIKRGGKRRQAFSPSKIKTSIKRAAKEAGFSQKKIEEVVKEVGGSVIDFFGKKRIVKAVDIRKSILRRLERRAKAVVSKWKSFEKKKISKILISKGKALLKLRLFKICSGRSSIRTI